MPSFERMRYAFPALGGFVPQGTEIRHFLFCYVESAFCSESLRYSVRASFVEAWLLAVSI